MIHELDASAFPSIRSLFAGAGHRLIVSCVIDGFHPGRVRTSDATAPRWALTWSHGHGYDLAGRLEDGDADEVSRLIEEEVVASGEDPHLNHARLVDHVSPPGAADPRLLASREPILVPRRVYRLDLAREPDPPRLPAGYDLRPVDVALLGDDSIEWPMFITRPMERIHGSAAGFLERGLAVAALRDGRLAGYCSTNCVHERACELAIRTEPEDRRRGLGLALTVETVRRAWRRGHTRIDWHCEESNTASVHLAEAAGFVHVGDYSFRVFFGHPAAHCVQVGHHLDVAGESAAALLRFRRAMEMEDCPEYAWSRAAGALARLGRGEEAIRMLERAIERGYRWRRILHEHTHYAALRALPEFEEVAARVPDEPL